LEKIAGEEKGEYFKIKGKRPQFKWETLEGGQLRRVALKKKVYTTAKRSWRQRIRLRWNR